MSGEHGDGRARSELLPTMYSPAAISLFERVKGLFDPDDVLNPGVLVVRRGSTPRCGWPRGCAHPGPALAFLHDGG